MPIDREIDTPLRRKSLLITRDFQSDLQRLIGSPQGGGPDHQTRAFANPTPAPTPGPGAVQMGGAPAVGSGPIAQSIIDVATRRVNDPATKPASVYYSIDPPNACASFVSTVLREAGAFGLASDFTRSCVALSVALPRTGAAQVVSDSTPVNRATVSRLLPGDIILFQTSKGARFHHSAIYAGGGKIIALNSTPRLIERSTLLHYGEAFMAAWRYSN